MIFGSLLTVGDNSNIRMSMMSMRLRIDMRKDIWRNIIGS